MEAHAVRADVGEMVHAVDRIERRARLVAEGVATPIADGPEAEGEVVVGLSLVVVGHGAMFLPRNTRGNSVVPRRANSVVPRRAEQHRA